MKFHAMLEQTGKTSTGIRVPEEIVNELRAGKRPPVHVTIKGYTYRTTVAPMGGEFWIGVSAEVREMSGATGGDELDVEVVLDTEPREITVPPDFAEALNREAEAKQFFDGLSYSNKRRFVYSIEDAKTPETRQRRIEKSVATLLDRKI